MFRSVALRYAIILREFVVIQQSSRSHLAVNNMWMMLLSDFFFFFNHLRVMLIRFLRF